MRWRARCRRISTSVSLRRCGLAGAASSPTSPSPRLRLLQGLRSECSLNAGSGSESSATALAAELTESEAEWGVRSSVDRGERSTEGSTEAGRLRDRMSRLQTESSKKARLASKEALSLSRLWDGRWCGKEYSCGMRADQKGLSGAPLGHHRGVTHLRPGRQGGGRLRRCASEPDRSGVSRQEEHAKRA
jgi:hypothetical protein